VHSNPKKEHLVWHDATCNAIAIVVLSDQELLCLAYISNISIIRWTNHWCQFLNDVSQTEIHTAEPLVPEPSAFEVEMAMTHITGYQSRGEVLLLKLFVAFLSPSCWVIGLMLCHMVNIPLLHKLRGREKSSFFICQLSERGFSSIYCRLGLHMHLSTVLENSCISAGTLHLSVGHIYSLGIARIMSAWSAVYRSISNFQPVDIFA